jgi:hypothetical protein
MEFRPLVIFLFLPCVAAQMTDIEVFLLVSTCVLGGLLALSAGALVYCYCIPKETAAPAVVIQQAPPPPKAPGSTNQIQPINNRGSGTAGTGVAARPILSAGTNAAALQKAQRAKDNPSTKPQTPVAPASVTNVAMNPATADGDFV